MVNDRTFINNIDIVKNVMDEKAEEATETANKYIIEAYDNMAESKKLQFDGSKNVDESQKYKRTEAELNQLAEQITDDKNDNRRTDCQKVIIENAKQFVNEKAEEENTKANQSFEESRKKEFKAQEKISEAFKKEDESHLYKNIENRLDEVREHFRL